MEQFIEFKRDYTKVTARFDTDLPFDDADKITTGIPFEWDFGRPYLAEIMRRYFEKRLDDLISQIRRQSYEDGWREAKAKKVKRNCFSGYFGVSGE